MAIRFERDDRRQRITLVADDTITIEAWAAVGAQILLDRLWHYATLYDFTAATAAMPSPADMAKLTPALTELVQQEGSRGAVAFAATHDDDYARLSAWVETTGRRMLPLVRVFRTRQEAERWLDAVSLVSRPRV